MITTVWFELLVNLSISVGIGINVNLSLLHFVYHLTLLGLRLALAMTIFKLDLDLFMSFWNVLFRYWTIRTSIPGFIDFVYFDEFLDIDDLLTYSVCSFWYLFSMALNLNCCFFTTTSLTCLTYSLMSSHYLHGNTSSFITCLVV